MGSQPSSHLSNALHPQGRWPAAAVLDLVQLVAGLLVPGDLARHGTQALAPKSAGGI